MSRIANDPETIADMSNDGELADVIHNRLYPKLVDYKYSYNFSWLGIPIIQVPQDILALQEIIWGVKPDLIVETGIAHGGSLVFYASMLEIIGKGGVVGIDIDIRAHNRKAIENSPLFHRITLIEGSSIDKAVVEKVYTHAENCPNVMVILDSDHTYDHVSRELVSYSPLVKKGNYIIVMDTVIEDLATGSFPDRPWGKGNNPKTAALEFVKNNGRFEIDRAMSDKLLISACPDGFIKCVKDRP